MTSALLYENPSWFVLNHIGVPFYDVAKKEIGRFNTNHNCNLELFAPTYVVRDDKNGKVKMRTVSLTFHYVFVRGTLASVKALCGQSNGFSLLIDRVNDEKRYAVISDGEMASLKAVARAYKNCLPFFTLDDIDLEEGDLVEVVNGDFPGLVGTYMPKNKSNSGNIILNVYNNVGTIAFNVKATDVRVLEFSHKSARANDQIDAFVPNLLDAMRYYYEEASLPTRLSAKLAVFCRRMGVVRLSNHKLEARLQILLFGGNYILGNIEDANNAKNKFSKLKNFVTNEWTLGLIDLIMSIIYDDKALLRGAKARLDKLSPLSKAQRLLIEELNYYTAL